MAYLSTTSPLDGILLRNIEDPPGKDYFNIDDILAEEEMVPCEFKQKCTGLAYLDQVEALLVHKNQKKKSTSTQLLQLYRWN